MRKLAIAISAGWGLLLAASLAFGQGNSSINGGITGNVSGTSPTVNATNPAAAYQINGTTFASAQADAGGGFSIYVGQLAGANATASVKGFYTAVGWAACGGEGVGMSGTIVENNCYGWAAGSHLTIGTFNLFIATGAGRNDATAVNCVAAGVDSMGGEGTVTGCNGSVGVGVGSLKWGTTGPAQTVGVGTNAFGGNPAGTSVFAGDTCVGDSCFDSASAGTLSFDTGIGGNTGKSQTSGNYNFYGGYNAGSAEISGGHNVILAPNNLASVCTTGGDNILIGYEVDCLASGTNHEINIGGLLFYNNTSLAAPTPVCGTGSTVDSRANAKSGTLTCGTGTATTATITFASAYVTWNHCRITSQTADSSFGYTYTKAVLSLSATTLTSRLYDYDCDGY